MDVLALYDIRGNLDALDAVLGDPRAAHPDAVVVGGDAVPGPFARRWPAWRRCPSQALDTGQRRARGGRGDWRARPRGRRSGRRDRSAHRGRAGRGASRARPAAAGGGARRRALLPRHPAPRRRVLAGLSSPERWEGRWPASGPGWSWPAIAHRTIASWGTCASSTPGASTALRRRRARAGCDRRRRAGTAPHRLRRRRRGRAHPRGRVARRGVVGAARGSVEPGVVTRLFEDLARGWPSQRRARRCTLHAPVRGRAAAVVFARLLGGLAAHRRPGVAGRLPALLAVGLGPVTANVTNTVALVFSSVGSTLGSRIKLR